MPTGDQKKDSELPGFGGIYNSKNLAMYSYAHQNPTLYTDPDGNFVFVLLAGPVLEAVVADLVVAAGFSYALNNAMSNSSSGGGRNNASRIELPTITVTASPLGPNEPDDPNNNNRGSERLPRYLRNKMARIKNQTAAGGNRGVSGSVSEADAFKLGERFVGRGYRRMSNGQGLVSRDGLRTYRFPQAKRGVNPMTGEPWSRTGRVANFETKRAPGEKPVSNVHLDVH